MKKKVIFTPFFTNKRAQYRAFESSTLATLGELLEREDLPQDPKNILKKRNVITTQLKELFAGDKIM